MKKLWVFLLLCSPFAFSQDAVPNDYFQNPLDIPLFLSGNFGELRSNHFHSGLDIKTQQKTGLPVFAAADGYVKRIKVSQYGYGKALYVQHANGYSTVYAHLDRYAGDIQKYVKENQYNKESYEIELFPNSELLKVKKGDIIAYSGNSGSSGGPHLHFEIRDNASRPMNPMLFGIDIPDERVPLINSVFAYPSSEGAQVNGSENPVKLRLVRQQDGSYTTESIKAVGKIGFGVSAYDQQNGASNKNGTYEIKTTYNGEERFKVLFNKFSFDETRYLNRYIDYGYFETNKSRVQKLFRESNNPLSIFAQEAEHGYITIEDGLTSIYTIEVSDFKGNKVAITIPIEGKQEPVTIPKSIQKTQDYIVCNQGTSISKGKFQIYIPSESLYEDTYLHIEAKGDTLDFHEDVIPIHSSITLTVDASNYEKNDLEKLFIGRLNYKGVPYYNTTQRDGSKLSARIRTFGSYCIAMDTVAPTITPLNFADGKWISKNKTLELKIEDVESGVSSYRATLNGKFILTEYDYKKDLLVYDFDDNVVDDTENNLKVIVVDNVGNSTTFEATFFRKPL
ncbi:MAG: M23 family metallopeptidase [Flavobacteriaceae bacterium]